MTVTVAICTWNRADLLDRTLAEFARLRVPAGVRWELVVVNNDCSDHTDAVIAKYATLLPLVRVFEKRAGQSFARNAALAVATGDYLLWTDDDVLVEPDWMAELLDAHKRFDADLVFGRADPWWETAPPAWFGPAFHGHFAVVDLAPAAALLTDRRVTGFGVNHSFRTAALRALGGFDVALGYKKGGGGAGEDIDIFQRAFDAGLRVAYTPRAGVGHFIPAARCAKRFHRLRAWTGGVEHLSMLRAEAVAQAHLPTVAGVPRYFFRWQLGYVREYVAGVLRRQPVRAFLAELKLIRLAAVVRAMGTARRPARRLQPSPRPPAIHYLARRFYPDLYGGLEVSGWELVKAWHRAGVPVAVTAENYPDGPTTTDEVLPGVSVVRLKPVDRGRLWRVALLARIGWWASRLVVRCPGGVNVAALGEWVIASKLARPRRPIVFRLIGVSAAAARATGGRVGRVQRWAEQLAARLANRIVVESEHVKAEVIAELRVSSTKVSVIPTGVDLARFANASPAPTTDPPGTFRVLAVGRLSAEKDIGFLIRAVAKMARRDRARLILVGDGPERTALSALAAELGLTDRVTFVGKVADPERQLTAADVLVLPSRSESYGTALVEGMAAGLPCLGRAADPPRVRVACPEHIVDGVTGFLVHPHDPADLAKRLDQLCDDPELRKRMGAAGQARARERYGLVVMAERYLDEVRKLAVR